MSVHVYDCMLIFDSNRYSRDVAGVTGRVKQVIESHGGEVVVSRLWEDRRLAYPIGGHRKGTYWLTFFRANTQAIPKIERDFQLNEDVIRSLILKVDPRIADSLVSHAQAERPAEPRPPRERGDRPERGERSDRREPVGAGEAEA